jgi:hypothetical protein
MDIYRAANLVIRPIIEAARMTDNMLELGDPDGNAYGGASGAIEVLRRGAWGGALIAGVR